MPVDRAQLDELHQRMLSDLAVLTTGPEWAAWLQSARRFHRYSPQNQMLLAAQGATGLVASYRTWQRIPAEDGGTCQVAKGEKGLTILAPMTVTSRDVNEATGDEVVARGIRGFKAVKVFHQGQLVSAPQLAPAVLPELLTGENRWQHVWAAVQGLLEDLGYSVDVVTRSTIDTWNGRTGFTDRSVVVSDHLEPPQRLKTLLHEWAHVALQHDVVVGLSAEVREVEAESVAYLIAGTVRLDSAAYTLPYVAGWSAGQIDLVERTAQRVLATTADMIGRLESELGIDLTPDALATSAVDREVVDLDSRRSTDQSTAPPTALLPDVDEPDPSIDAAPGVMRDVLTRLEPDDRALLVTALNEIGTSLDIATALFADAGLDAPRTVGLLLRAGADPAALEQSMNRTVLDRDGRRVALFESASDEVAARFRGVAAPEAIVSEPARVPITDVGTQATLSPAEMILGQWAAMRVTAASSQDLV